MFGRDLICRVRIDGGKVVLAVDLHAMPSEEEQADVTFLEHVLEALERPVHVGMRTVGLPDDGEAAGFELAANILGIVHGVLQLVDRLVRSVADHQRIQSAAHAEAARYAAWTARTRDGCNTPSLGVCPCGAAGGTENHSVL